MKKLLILCTFTLTFFFSGTVGFSDILKDLDKFQQSLGSFVSQIDDLSSKIANLESDNASREKQISEFNQSMDNIEKLLSNLDAKVERVANMSSLEGVKEIVKSFEGTLNVFKTRFAKLANRLEDQEVKTAVLERMYKTANKPLDTLMTAIDEQKSVINNLKETLGNQEQIILSIKENLQKQESPDKSYAKSIEELNARLGKIESGYVVQKRELKTEAEKHFAKEDTHHEKAETEDHGAVSSAPHEKTKADTHTAAPVTHQEHGTDVHTATSDAHHKKPETDAHAGAPEAHHEKTETKQQHVSTSKALHEEPKAHKEKTDLTGIGEGIFINNIKFEPFGSSSQIKGKIVNKSDRNYGMADFIIQTFNKESVPLGDHRFSVYGFNKGITKSFEEIIVGVETKEISKYSIYPAKMPLVSETGESTIKFINLETAVAGAQPTEKEVMPDNLEDLIFDKKAQAPETLEGFESVGNGFYISNVSFNGFGSSTTVTGNVKNNSNNNFYNASFVLKVFSKSYGMLTSLDFSVRNIQKGDTKAFEEIVTGLQPVDIDRYEVTFKSSY